MSSDLPVVNCYDSTNCKNIYNCAPTISSYSCPTTNPPNAINNPTCPSGEASLYCYGSDQNYCSGIYQQCNPNLGLYCKTNITNPAQNYFSEHLGCNVKTDAGCFEFENSEHCQNNCWEMGGSDEMNEICSNFFKDANSCNAMKYFCSWDIGNNVCNAVTDDPWNLFKNGPRDQSGPKTSFTETVNGYTLNCAQSSWSSTQVNSYADTIRTCCISKPGSSKTCVTTPRCQFVNTTCECGFKDIDPRQNPSYNTNIASNPVKPWFMCADVEQNVIIGGNSYQQKGYCTWCKGTQLKNFDYRNWLINNKKLVAGEDIRDSIAWGTPDNCTNRCSNYNSCELNSSEKQWNECIWRHSNGTVGVDPTSSNLDLTKGFCYSEVCLNNAKTQTDIDHCNTMISLKNVCEQELQSNISTKNQLYPIIPNSNVPIAKRCTEGSQWTHVCNITNGTSYAENYACGWCPNLQNDWPDNPCSTSSPATSAPVASEWYSPLLVGVKTSSNQQQNQNIASGILVVIIIIIILALVMLGLFSRWLWKRSHPQ